MVVIIETGVQFPARPPFFAYLLLFLSSIYSHMKNSEVKKIVTESVIGFLNGKKYADDFDIPDEDKQKIEEIVKKTVNRQGFLALTYRTDSEEGKTSVGARIDPTAKGDWILAKEELLYEIPIKYNYKLHEFVNKIKKNLMS